MYGFITNQVEPYRQKIPDFGSRLIAEAFGREIPAEIPYPPPRRRFSKLRAVDLAHDSQRRLYPRRLSGLSRRIASPGRSIKFVVGSALRLRRRPFHSQVRF